MKLDPSLLKELRKTLYFTLSIYIENKASKDDVKHLVNIIRKIELTILLQEKDIYAIGGTQGAGKTTLVKEMLNITDDWLEGNPGRGEQVPLFIEQSEDESLVEPKAVFVCLEKETRNIIEKDNITKEELKQVLQGWEQLNTEFSNENLSILYPKLYIPSEKSFINKNLNWVLLPGYEKINYKNNAWQNLMKHIFVNANGIIIVTDGVLLANNNQNDITQDLSKFLADRNPVIAVTKTENMSQEDKTQLANTASSIFNKRYNDRYNEIKTDNIVLTGHGNKNEWSDKLKETINNCSYSSSKIQTYLLESFQDLLENDIEKIVFILDTLRSNCTESHDEKLEIINDILSVFDKSAGDYNKKLRKDLRHGIRTHTLSAINLCETKYKNEEEGFINNIKIFGRKLLLQGQEIQRERLGRIESAWNSKYNEKNIYIITGNVITNLNGKEFQKNGFFINKFDNLLIENKSTSVTQLLNYSSGDIEGLPQKEMPLKALQGYLYGKNQELDNINLSDKEEALKLIPVLAMEFARGCLILSEKNTEISHPCEITPQMFLEKLFDGTEKITPIRNSMMALLGLDMSDGKIDGKYEPNPDAKFSPIAVLGKAALAMTAAYTLYQITSVIRESDQVQITFIKNTMMNFETSYIQSVVDIYENAINDIREIIENNIKSIYDIPDSLSLKSDITLAKSRLERIQKVFKGYLIDAQNILA
ncbi:hypothetical protein [Proteus genomosp. 4]|uniref:hypothetical protein n=1 Tax=Proteus genomosp. 4 TaxID=1311818 RepID=UPI000D69BBD3|nr:hypothetical protein [Proteus genomosp. 4]